MLLLNPGMEPLTVHKGTKVAKAQRSAEIFEHGSATKVINLEPEQPAGGHFPNKGKSFLWELRSSEVNGTH